MDFGKKVYVGNFFIMKKTRSLSKREIDSLRNDAKIPLDVRKRLTRGQLPYMRVESVGGGWAIEFNIEQTMFAALDELIVVRDVNGVLRVSGVTGKNLAAIFVGMFTDTTIVGDEVYQRDKIKALDEYIKRSTNKKE